MFNIVIYSKDRACQLDLLLRSIETNFENWENQNLTVIYKATFTDYRVGYDICRWEHRNFMFVDEEKEEFKRATMRCLNPKNLFTLWFMDDNVMLRRFSKEDAHFQRFARDPNILCLSLRMHPGVTSCYTENKPTPPPQISPEGIWDWTTNRHNGDWSYPMALDGHIFRTNTIAPLVNNLPYSNPNTMEGALAQHPIPIPQMICYPEPRIINIPANKVQTVNNNRAGNVDTLLLNRLYLLGKRIDLNMFQGMVKPSVHSEVPYKFGDAIDGIGDLMHLQ